MYWIIILVVLVFIMGFAMLYGQKMLSRDYDSTVEVDEDGEPIEGSGDLSFQESVYATIFHPKILGLIVIIIVAVFAMVFLTRAPSAE